MISINRTEYFEIAHNLFPYDGGCFSIHGHSYKVTVEISGPQIEPLNMICDFKVLKQIMKEVIPDHAYIYDSRLLHNTDEKNIIPELVPLLERVGMHVVGYDCTTTCENLVQIWADSINKRFYDLGYKDIYVSKLTANETQNSQAVYKADFEGNPYSTDVFDASKITGILVDGCEYKEGE